MSLINQMLQDLEKRQPGGDSLPLSTVRAVPRQRRLRFFWPLLMLLLLTAAVLAWQFWQAAAFRQARPLPAVAATPAPAAAPAAAPEPAPVPETAPVPQPATPAPMPEPPGPLLSDNRPLIAPTLKESTELTRLPQMPPAPKPAAQPLAAAASQATSATAHQQKTAPGTQPGSGAVAPAVPGVAKQVRESTPQQRADTEYRKALALVQQGRISEAIDSLALAVQLDAGHTSARQTLIGLLVEARRFGEAERRLQEGLGLDRAQPELAMTLARLQVERGDTGAAIATLERSQSSATERADYQAFMAALLQRAARHGEAIEHYRQALRRSSSAVWQMGLGISLQAENRFQEAREAFSRARAANTLSPELQAFVEQRLRQLGQ